MNNLYLDHVLIGVRDLAETVSTFGERIGFTVTPEGVHPGRGTHNRLIVFGPEYLELISVRDPSEGLFRPNLPTFLESREGLFIFAIGTDDVDAGASELRSKGINVADPVDGARSNEDGSVAYSWRQAEIAADEMPGSQTFLIQHNHTVAERYREPAEPTRHANGASAIGYLALAVHDATEAASRWREIFGLEAASAREDAERGVKEVAVALDDCELRFLSPLREGPLSQFLERNGEGPYELGIQVADLKGTSAYLAKQEALSAEHGGGEAAVIVRPELCHQVRLRFAESR